MPPSSLNLQKSGKFSTPRSAPGPLSCPPRPPKPLPLTGGPGQIDACLPRGGGNTFPPSSISEPNDDVQRIQGWKHQGSIPVRVWLCSAGQHTLPSGLRALSTVANAGEVVAIDTQHTLFFSNDGGAHWSVISQPWQGRAVKVELARASYPTGKPDAAVAGIMGGVLGGIKSHDSVEGPKATLSGGVTDPSGASIPNASVAVTNSLTQAVHRTTTDPTGRYRVDELAPGTYTLEVQAPGFTPREVSRTLAECSSAKPEGSNPCRRRCSPDGRSAGGSLQLALTAPKVTGESLCNTS